jgi:hypothetical protein
MHLRSLALMFLLCASLVLAQSASKKQDAVPKFFFTAHYAYVQAVDGDRFDFRLVDEDRRAIADVENALRDWNRYMVTAKRQEAELVFAVRKGRTVETRGSVGTGGGSYPPNGGVRGGVGAGVGPTDDLLYVYTVQTDGSLQGPIWKQYLKDGLDAPDILLFKQLKDAVEAASKQQTHSK